MNSKSAAGAAVDTAADNQKFIVDETGFISSGCINVLADWRDCTDKIQAFRKLCEDWDGDGSAAPDRNVIDVAATVAHNLSRNKVDAPDRIHVGVNGTIYFEWFDADKYVEIEVAGPADIHCRVIPHGSNAMEQLSLSASEV